MGEGPRVGDVVGVKLAGAGGELAARKEPGLPPPPHRIVWFLIHNVIYLPCPASC